MNKNYIKKSDLNIVNILEKKIFWMFTSMSFCINNNRTISVYPFLEATMSALLLNAWVVIP